MRVRLSYTAEVDEVLSEAAFLLGNLAGTLQDSASLYNKTITELKGGEFNPNKFQENIDTLRQNLGKVDTRCLEVEQIVIGLGEYQRQDRTPFIEDEHQEEDSSPAVKTTESEGGDD